MPLAPQPAVRNPQTAGNMIDFTATLETIMTTLFTSTHLSRLITTAIFGALALSGSAASIAADTSEAPQVIVKFGDLNLSNPQGAAKLYSRITTAAYEVCKSFDVNRDLGSRARLTDCLHKAIADAVTKVGQPELIAIYNAKNHQPLPTIVVAAHSR
jgi:UrcA family protein